jgi:flagellar capping protein FliD
MYSFPFFLRRALLACVVSLCGVGAHAQSPAPIRLALIEGLSGPFANTGEAVVRNIAWAVERVNARGGVKTSQGLRPMVLERYDSKGQSEEALSALKSAIDDGAQVVLQGNSSANAAALIDAINKHNEREPAKRVLFLNYSAVDPVLTNEKCSFWHFRFDAHADMRMAALMQVLREDQQVQSAYLSVDGVSKGSIDVVTDTPAGLVSAINGASLGVTAQLIDTSNGYYVVVTGETGEAQNFSLTSNDGTGTALSGVSFATSLQTATDASIKINGLEVTRTSNTITDVIDGVTLDLYANSTGAARLDLNRDTTGIKDNIKGLVTAYNDFEAAMNILGDRDSDVEEFGGALAGDNLLQTVRTQVRNLVISTSTTPGTTIQAARDVGLSIDRNGKLTLNETKLDTALQSYFDEVSTMFSAGTNNQSIYSSASAGLAGDAINSIEKMLLSTGLIDTQSKSATTQIAKYKEELTELESRMDKLLTRYMSQFSIMESMVGNSNSMREGLKSTFTGMMKAYD